MALIELSGLKTFLKLPSDYTDEDDKLQILIDLVNDSIDKYVGRTLVRTTYRQEKYDGPGTECLTLRNYPLRSIQNIYIGTTEISYLPDVYPPVPCSGVLPLSLGLDIKDTIGWFEQASAGKGQFLTAEEGTVVTIGSTGTNTDVTVNALINDEYFVAYINSTGSEITLDRDPGESFEIEKIEAATELKTPDYSADSSLGYYYVTNPGDGIVNHSLCWPIGRAVVTVNYVAGYDEGNYPADLIAGAYEMAAFYRAVTEKSGINSESLGSYSASLMTTQNMEGGLTIPSILFRMVLDRYRCNYFSHLNH